ncbi:MAG: methyltransferase domain-containing protein [Lachnospiraceae bacterium]|nr:methyltransferase domain-containing protein [Lachnospiraceae bacterium]
MGEIQTIREEQESGEIKERVESYWTKRADSFFEQKEAEIRSEKYDRWEEELLAQLPKREGLRILDVGCGCGFFGIILARQGHRVTGIDLTPSMVERGREMAREFACEVEFAVMDAEKPDFPEESFDVVLSRNLTWTLPHPAEAYAAWQRVLKPGGLLLNYDAEYAKDHHRVELPANHAHHMLGEEMREECHQIYHMLSVSSLSRPDWDLEVLRQLGMRVEAPDLTVGRRIYREKDRFYVPQPIFRVKAWKE